VLISSHRQRSPRKRSSREASDNSSAGATINPNSSPRGRVRHRSERKGTLFLLLDGVGQDATLTSAESRNLQRYEQCPLLLRRSSRRVRFVPSRQLDRTRPLSPHCHPERVGESRDPQTSFDAIRGFTGDSSAQIRGKISPLEDSVEMTWWGARFANS
jgi:hypothetical protein